MLALQTVLLLNWFSEDSNCVILLRVTGLSPLGERRGAGPPPPPH